MINEFKGEYFFLSNFYSKSPFVHEGITFANSESAFMYFKNLTPEYQSSILRAESPGAAKRLGRACVLREDWEQVKEKVMFDVLWSKFYPGTKMSERLQATGEHVLREGNSWGDEIWGCTIHEQWVEDPCNYDRNCCIRTYTGKNKLGHILMAIRQLQK